MNFPLYIARRYLFSKKSHNAINIISMVSVCGVVIATMALVCALSIFNGFDGLVASMFGSFDPELKISPKTGKVFDPSISAVQQIKQLPEITFYSETLSDNALVRYGERQEVAVIKGVDEAFAQVADMEQILVDGRFVLREDVVDYASLGIGLAFRLGVNVGFVSPLELYVPKRGENINMANPASSLSTEYAFIGGIYRMNQQVYDDNYMIVPLELARALFRYENEVSAIELKLVAGADLSSVKKQIKNLLGEDFLVHDRYEQQEASFKMMQIEKWMTFLILTFILAIAIFNIVGSLSMLMIEKKEDVRTLRNMGADEPLIRRIFLFEGWMISGFGALIGIILGVILCILQQELGLIRLGQSAEAFIVDAYPVQIVFSDILIVFITVLGIGFLAAWYPVRYLGKRWLSTT
ncbi:ABC transporter permease [Parabacteroides sp. PF5-9]|uniref:ABC transporter permease n=1 Tax=Parabacteroides sp. PF5-9 TaxID=1742404 RepID=UPI002476F65A|nr:ABC transporter permease [Parabacteroides sp. PF5-9]